MNHLHHLAQPCLWFQSSSAGADPASLMLLTYSQSVCLQSYSFSSNNWLYQKSNQNLMKISGFKFIRSQEYKSQGLKLIWHNAFKIIILDNAIIVADWIHNYLIDWRWRYKIKIENILLIQLECNISIVLYQICYLPATLVRLSFLFYLLVIYLYFSTGLSNSLSLITWSSSKELEESCLIYTFLPPII